MKLGLYRKYFKLIILFEVIRFILIKFFIGFDAANNYFKRVNKFSVKLILEKFGAKIGNNCDIETGLTFHNCKDYSNLRIGNNCHIGKNCFFDLRDKVIIEDNVVISMQCTFITHIDMSKSDLSNLFPPKQQKILIKKNVYIGANATILKGIKIPENSLIAAGSVVIKNNIEAYTMVGGVPAKFIKKIGIEK